jgi:signal transduction histidine kinase/ligand-binding sensor domain-containing protein/CheY-like chemotaxis protein
MPGKNYKRPGKWWAAAIYLFLAPTVRAALDPGKAITQYRHDIWTTDQGLPQNSVVAIVQTRDGYLWFGTELGLVRFDGLRFTVFDRKNTPGLKSNMVYVLLEDRQGSLWIGSAGGGLTRFRNGVFTTFTTKDGLSNDMVLSLHEDRAGDLWIGTDGGGLNRLRNGEFTVYTTKNGLANDAVYAIIEDGKGNLWAGTHGGLSRLTNGRFASYTVQDGLQNDYVRALCPDRDGGFWIGTNGGGLSRFKDGKIQIYSTKDGLPSDAIWSILQDSSGSLWIGTIGGGVSRMAGGTFTTYNDKDGLSGNDVWSLYQDRDGSLWIGTGTGGGGDGGGLNRLTEGKFTAWGAKEGLSNDVTLPIFEDRQGSLWIGTNGGGVNRFRDGKFTAITTKEGLADNLVLSICEDREGAIWFGTRKGVNRLKNGKLTVYTTRDGLAGDSARVTYMDRRGDIWIGTRGGLSKFKNGAFQTYTKKDGMSNNSVQAILEDHAGSLWVGTGGGGLNRLKDGKFEVFDSQRGLSSGFVTSIHEDASGVLWVGTTTGGLSRLKDGNFTAYTTKSGLPDDAVFQILEDASDHLWMSSNAGIFRVSKRELNDFADGRIRSLSPVTFGPADGMRSKECNGGFQPAGWKARDGKLWFPTMKGVVAVDPEHLGPARAPLPVFIEHAEIDRREVDPGASYFQARPGAGELEFRYAAISFHSPDKTIFKYKLEGFDRDWIDAGVRRTAYYTNISPGAYRFRVMARNSDGVWSSGSTSLGFSLKPHFFQTIWFYGLCFLGIVCVAAGLPILRVRQLHARARVLSLRVAERTEELRKEIVERECVEKDLLKAREAEQASRIESEFLANMSHEIRTPINGIRGMTELTLKSDLTAEQSENLITVRDCTDALLTVVNDILDFSKIAAGKLELDPIDFNLRECLQATLKMVAFQSQQKGLALSCDIRPEVPVMVRGDLFRLRQILLNLLNNSVKFTEHGEVCLRVDCGSREGNDVWVHFEVRDTGIGIPLEKQKLIFEAFSQAERSTTRRFGGTGLGLTISSRLVRLMGGELSVKSETGHGSRFHFTARFGTPVESVNAVESPSHASAPSNAVPEGVPAVPLRILIAEDNLVNQRVASKLLQKRGHTSVIANNGREVLSILKGASFDVILMDLQMPEMDGFEATIAIREEEKRTGAHLPIIALTAHAMDSYKTRCLQAGMDSYVTKPIQVKQLFETIESLVGVMPGGS